VRKKAIPESSSMNDRYKTYIIEIAKWTMEK
jgi:hypothetical protein